MLCFVAFVSGTLESALQKKALEKLVDEISTRTILLTLGFDYIRMSTQLLYKTTGYLTLKSNKGVLTNFINFRTLIFRYSCRTCLP